MFCVWSLPDFLWTVSPIPRAGTWALPQTRKRVYVVGIHEKVGHRKEMNIVFELLTCIFPIAYENERCDMKAIAHSVHASGKPLTYPGASKDCLSIGGISWNIDLDNMDSWWRCQEAGASQVLVFP